MAGKKRKTASTKLYDDKFVYIFHRTDRKNESGLAINNLSDTALIFLI